MDNGFEIRKKKLELLAIGAGYKNLRKLCETVGVNEANLYSNLRGTFKMSMKRMFAISNAVRRPVDEIIKIFFPDEMAENEEICRYENERLVQMSMRELKGYVMNLKMATNN